jgi:hypothetical protein
MTAVLVPLMQESVMSGATLEERVAELERQVRALLANHAGTGRARNWRRTRGAFTGDDFMKQVFEEGRKIREAERKRGRPRRGKKWQAPS